MNNQQHTPKERLELARKLRRDGKHEAAQWIEDDLAIPSDEHGNCMDVEGNWLPPPESAAVTNRREVRRGQEAMLVVWLNERGILDQQPRDIAELQQVINRDDPRLDDLPDDLVRLRAKTHPQ